MLKIWTHLDGWYEDVHPRDNKGNCCDYMTQRLKLHDVTVWVRRAHNSCTATWRSSGPLIIPDYEPVIVCAPCPVHFRPQTTQRGKLLPASQRSHPRW